MKSFFHFRNLVIVLLVAVIAALGAQILSLRNQASQNQAMMQQMLRERSSRSARDEDPYVKNQVKNTILKNTGEIQACYLKFLEAKPKQKNGLVLMDWYIEPDGRVSEVKMVTSALGDSTLENCMKAIVGGWSFPPPPLSQRTYVNHRFIFQNEENKAERKAKIQNRG